MEFSPKNNVVQLCVQGMDLESKGKPEEAGELFHRAWNEATDNFEKYLSAYFVARHHTDVADKLTWFETALRCALAADRDAIQGALATLHSHLAGCYQELGDRDNARKHEQLARSFKETWSDKGPFYHGTKADLRIGDLLTAGGKSNYTPDLTMHHVYFTALPNGAGLAAALAKGDGRERVYIVEPTGSFEYDPNVSDKKFPGNPTRSYRTREPLRIVGEVPDWRQQTPEDVRRWRDRLANSKGDIIN